jgi:lantibiotic modifying enzyme
VVDNQLREQVLNEAIRIGDKLLERAERDENGIFWQTLQSEGRGNYSKGVSVTLYDGVPGIAVFLMQLFQMTQSQKYLDAARGGMDWSVEHSRCNPSDNFALFTGRMGVCFALKRLFEVTHESEYMEQALSIAKGAEQFVSSNNSRNDLLNGRAGTLLGLLHLDALSQEQWITPLIELGIEQLIDQSHDGPTGLYWDRSPDQIHGLCGFSHGSAGVGYAWLEMGRHFRNPTFYW